MAPRNISINITSSTIVKVILFVLLVVFIYYLRDLFLVILSAVVIASALEPAISWLSKMRIGRLPSVVLVYVSIGLCIVSLLVFFVPTVINEALFYLNDIPKSISSENLWGPVKGLGPLGQTVTEISSNSLTLSKISGFLKDLVKGAESNVFQVLSVAFGGILSFILIIVFSFYLSVQENGVRNFLQLITPLKHDKYIVDLWERSQKKIGYWLQGQIVLSILVGTLVYIALMVVGVPHALLLAVVATLFELIPVFGPILASIPAIVISLADGGATLALFTAGIYIIIHQFENHLFYPLVVRKMVGISPIVVIIALIIGLKLGGILGGILAIPISAVLMEYLGDVEEGKRKEREA